MAPNPWPDTVAEASAIEEDIRGSEKPELSAMIEIVKQLAYLNQNVSLLVEATNRVADN